MTEHEPLPADQVDRWWDEFSSQDWTDAFVFFGMVTPRNGD